MDNECNGFEELIGHKIENVFLKDCDVVLVTRTGVTFRVSIEEVSTGNEDVFLRNEPMDLTYSFD